MLKVGECWADRSVEGCQQWSPTLSHAIQPQQYCAMLLTAMDNMAAQRCLILLYYRLITFDCVNNQDSKRVG